MEIILTLTGVVVIPLAIVAFLPRDRNFFERGIVRGFGLGVYLMLVIVLLYEAVDEGGVGTGFLWLFVGLLVSLAIGLFFKEFHHHHSDEEKFANHSRASTCRILVSDFFHNIVDGIAIIAGFAVSPAIGLISFLGILGHQTIQQVGQQILLVESGVPFRRALFVSFLIALSIFLGFVVQESLESILLAFSAGIVAWKVWVDLIHLRWDKKVVSGLVLGSLLLSAILLSVPHQHSDEEHKDEESEQTTE